MTDYEALHRRLWQEIAAHEKALDATMQAFVRQFLLRLRAEGWVLSGDAEQALNDHLNGIESGLKAAVTRAVAVGTGLPLTAARLQSATVLAAAEKAFTERWPDGLSLSERLWAWQKDTRDGVLRELRAGVRLGQSTGKTVYAMQRAIERTTGSRFKLVQTHQDDWVRDLYESGSGLIRNPDGQVAWQAAVDEAEERIADLARTGTRTAAEQVLGKIREGVARGREDLLDEAVKWWTYDKQLYGLKRIVRTEMATAAHRAVIATSIADPDIIGYQWRLSASHRVPDICDYYAGIEMGLGRGVFTKDAVPPGKAHPHCMCLIIPRVTPVEQKGDRHYADFIKNTSDRVREAMLPEWVKEATAAGVPLEALVRPDGMDLLTKKAATDTINVNTVENIVAKLAEKAKNAKSLADIWTNLNAYPKHIDRRIEKNHIKDDADYFAKVKSTLATADRFNFIGGKYPSAEMISGNWSVILNHDGYIKTAYRHEKNGESFTEIQTRWGHIVYEYNIGKGLGGQLKKLFD